MRSITALLIAMMLMSIGCKPVARSPDSGLSNLAASSSVRNIAIVVLGDSSGIEGTLTDFDNMQQVFTQLGFLVVPLKYATSAAVRSAIAQAAAEMVPQDQVAMGMQQRGGTLAIYITSHGDQDGGTSVGGGNETVTMAEMVQAIGEGRARGSAALPNGANPLAPNATVNPLAQTFAQGPALPLQRLVVMFDTCYSGKNATAVNQGAGGSGIPGNLINNLNPVPTMNPLATPSSLPPVTSAQALPNGVLSSSALMNVATNNMAALRSYRGLYLSSYAIYSSQPTETSDDTSSGGAATKAFIAVLRSGLTGLGPMPLPNAYRPTNPQSQYSTIPGAGSSSYAYGTSAYQSQDAGQMLGSGHRMVSSMTLKGLADGIFQQVNGSQNPIVCAHPVQTFNDFVGDPPPGVLPALIPNITADMQPKCVQNSAGIQGALQGL